ncbi:MAG TPA: hypothetical protein VG099_27030 [Gemmataceae bacterium]|jgi:hypothetical protein|nr:hypothetical protein [Gemmataceae bacterium]
MRLVVALLVTGFSIGCQNRASTSPENAEVQAAALELSGPIQAAGLHNVFRITDKLISGSCPEGEPGFASLQELNVQTILSVDGARPEVALAHKYGMRYVHLPIGYDGIRRDQALRIAKAVRDLPGVVYIHCHHGKHRGPAAAAVAHLCLDEHCAVESALAEMRRAGTDPHYTGLYAAPVQLRRPTPQELDGLLVEFPETAAVKRLAQFMVRIDETLEHLKEIRVAGWQAPTGHADLDPPQEALQLAEHYREASRLDEMRLRPEEFRAWLREAEQDAQVLEKAARRHQQTHAAADATATEAAFRKASSACTRCHERFRDVPQKLP